MPSPYSKDLRQRVMAHYERHGSATLTSQVFNISRSIIYDWKKLKQDTGDIQAKTGYQHGHSHKITDLAAFKARIDDSTGLTLKQMIQQSGIAMSQMTCSRALKRLGMTRKKSYGFKERSEEKRQAFKALLATYSAQPLIYLDEAGIDGGESYPYAWAEKGKRAWAKRSGKRYTRLNRIAL